MERVRRYQVNRLKYYYAVAVLDCVETAARVYEECDGMEYELSATRLDLRFIPSEMAFTAAPESSCLSPPDPDKYTPKVFCTTALQQGKVELTWDEEDQSEEKEEEAEDRGSINKYRALLADIGQKESREQEQGNMELTWNDEDVTEEAQEELTPWEKYLEKKRDKKKKVKKDDLHEDDEDDIPE